MPPPGAAWSFLRNRRNMVLACAISIGAHALVYWSIPAFIAAWHEPPTAIYDAVLVPAALEPSPSATAAVKASTARAAPRRPAKPPSAPPPPLTEPSFAAPENAIATAPASEPVPVAPPVAAVPEAAPEPAPAVPPVAEEAPTPVAAAEAPPELPARISIAYRMTSSVSDGVADYSWKRDGNQYEIDSTMQATGFIIGSLVGALHQVSRGEVTPGGLEPMWFSIRRGDAEADTAEFTRSSKEMKLVRRGKPQTLPLPPRIQDMQSFLFQLAYDAPRLKSPEDRLDVMVTNARKVYRHRFRQLGVETVKTRAGPVEALHLLSEAADPEDAYEVWLALKNYHLPVKIKFFAGRFPIELIATSIRSTP